VDDFDPFSEAYFDDPFSFYRRLRNEAPDLYVPRYDCFFLSRFEDVWDAVSNPSFSHGKGTTSMELLLGAPRHSTALSSMLPPGHTALRKSIASAFTPSAARRLEAPTRALVSDFLDGALAHGKLDVISDLALRISARVAFLILGLPLEDADVVAGRVNDTFHRSEGVRGNTERAAEASQMLHAYLAEKIEERRTRSGEPDDLIGALLHYEHEGERLSDEQLVSNVFLLVVGGTETLPKVFSGLLYQLWKHPEQRAEVAHDPGLAKDAFWEGLRYEMPTLMLGAAAEEDTEICGGTPVRRGQKLMHLWVSANRDEREFEEPDRFDIHRRAERILSFNHGRHRCLGAHIAQMEGRVLLEELLARIPDYEVIEEEAVRIRSEFFRGFSRLPIRF